MECMTVIVLVNNNSSSAFDGAGPVRLTGVWFSNVKPAEGGLFNVSVISTGRVGDAAMRITVSYVLPLTTDDEAAVLRLCLERHLLAAVAVEGPAQ